MNAAGARKFAVEAAREADRNSWDRTVSMPEISAIDDPTMIEGKAA
jgi:hypothetical protein